MMPPRSPQALLRLMWLASPALPIGGFSYSDGLETPVALGLVATEAQTLAWLTDQLHLGLARSDLAIMAQALPAWQAGDAHRLQKLNQWVLQSRETSELRQQTEQMGRSLAAWLQGQSVAPAEQVKMLAAMPPTYPVAFALAASTIDAPLADCLLAFAFAWAENMVAAAIKSIPLGQSAGQRILAHLVQEIPVAVDWALGANDSARQAFTPMLAILSAQHETQYARLFRS